MTIERATELIDETIAKVNADESCAESLRASLPFMTDPEKVNAYKTIRNLDRNVRHGLDLIVKYRGY